MCKTLTVETIPKVGNIVGTIITEENAKRNTHVIAPTDVTMREAQDEQTTQLCEVEHIRLQGAVWRGNLRLCELEKDQV